MLIQAVYFFKKIDKKLLYIQANKNSNGMPISVQCVTLPFEDEKCLKLMKEVESLLLTE